VHQSDVIVQMAWRSILTVVDEHARSPITIFERDRNRLRINASCVVGNIEYNCRLVFDSTLLKSTAGMFCFSAVGMCLVIIIRSGE
jgi:hypothetical protein